MRLQKTPRAASLPSDQGKVSVPRLFQATWLARIVTEGRCHSHLYTRGALSVGPKGTEWKLSVFAGLNSLW